MNLFAEMETEIRAALAALQVQGKLADGVDMSRLTVEPPRGPRMAIWRLMRQWCWPKRPK